jgi:hypothetical protein
MTSHGSPPSDLDLMLYADGELEAERVAEVEAWLAADAAARDKLAGLCTVSRVVREGALDAAAGADDLADRIMAAIAPPAPLAPPAPQPPVTMGETPKPPARPAPAPIPCAPSPAANDNGRRVLFVVAALVATAAAALLWVRPPGGVMAGRGRPVTMEGAERPRAQPLPPAHSAGPAGTHGVEADVEHGVEVAAIDFGSTTGAVFYVPNGTSSSDTTTLVWLSDEPDGEDE